MTSPDLEPKLVLTPFWRRDERGWLRRDGDRCPTGPREVELARAFAEPATAREAAQRSGFPLDEVDTAAMRLRAAGVLDPAMTAAPPPLEIELELTGACTADCVMCPRDLLKATRGARHMESAVIDAVLSNLAGQGVATWYLSGLGEPLLHPRWQGVVQALSARDPGVRIVVYSNGSTLDEESIEALLASPVDEIELSLHTADAETHRAMVRGGDIGHILTNVDRLLERRATRNGRPLEVKVSRCEVPGSVAGAEELAQWCSLRGLGFDRNPPWSRAGTVVLGEGPPVPHRNPSPQWCRHYACVIFVDHLGRVLPCCCDVRGDAVELDATRHTLKKIRAHRLERLASGRPLSSLCHRCDCPASNYPFLETEYFRVARANFRRSVEG